MFINIKLGPRKKVTFLSSLVFAASAGVIYNRYFRTTAFASSRNQIFLPIRYRYELDSIIPLSNRIPLLLNFTYRGDKASDKTTGALQRIVGYETEKRINMVDVEVDEPEVRDILPDYAVNRVPLIVAIKRTLPADSYYDRGLDENKEGEVDWEKLKAWVESVADD